MNKLRRKREAYEKGIREKEAERGRDTRAEGEIFYEIEISQFKNQMIATNEAPQWVEERIANNGKSEERDAAGQTSRVTASTDFSRASTPANASNEQKEPGAMKK